MGEEGFAAEAAALLFKETFFRAFGAISESTVFSMISLAVQTSISIGLTSLNDSNWLGKEYDSVLCSLKTLSDGESRRSLMLDALVTKATEHSSSLIAGRSLIIDESISSSNLGALNEESARHLVSVSPPDFLDSAKPSSKLL